MSLPAMSESPVHTDLLAVSIPVYTVKGWFTTCVPQFLEHTAGIHLPDAGSDIRTSPAGG